MDFEMPENWFKLLPEEVRRWYKDAKPWEMRSLKKKCEPLFLKSFLSFKGRNAETWLECSHALKLAAGIYRNITRECFTSRLFLQVCPESERDRSLGERWRALEGLGKYLLLKILRIDLMLAGLSLELLIKAILIAQNPDRVSKSGVDDKIAHHRLLDLLYLAKIDISREQRKLIKSIQPYIEWTGRYPIPKDFTKANVKQSAFDYEQFEAVYKALNGHHLLVEIKDKKIKETIEVHERFKKKAIKED